MGAAESVVYQAVIIMIAEGAPVGQLGYIQGVASAAAAGMRMTAPSIAGVLWELGLKGGSSGFVFGVVVCIIGGGVVFARWIGGRKVGEYVEIGEEYD